MFDFIMEFSNIPAEYTIYASFLASVIIRFAWLWNIEYHFNDTIRDCHEWNAAANNPMQQMKQNKVPFSHLNWLVKCIKKKENPGEDPDTEPQIL